MLFVFPLFLDSVCSFDEWVPWTCDRIMPYRTRSRRPITLAAEAVRDMIKDLNHDENCFLARVRHHSYY
jgi:hypothetical protein